jgi:hypothetical protein
MFTVVNGLDGWYLVGRSWELGVVVMGCLSGTGDKPEDTPKLVDVKKGGGLSTVQSASRDYRWGNELGLPLPSHC